MYGLAVNLTISLSGHLSNIDEIPFSLVSEGFFHAITPIGITDSAFVHTYKLQGHMILDRDLSKERNAVHAL
jgi:hypothetical protein